MKKIIVTLIFFAVTSCNNNQPAEDGTPTTQRSVLVFTTGQPAALSIGANSPATAGPGGATINTIDQPWHISFDFGHLLIGMTGRLGIMNAIPTTNAANLNMVVGEYGFNGGTLGAAGITVNAMSGSYDGTRLWVMDSNFPRVMAYNPLPTTLGATSNFGINASGGNGCGGNTYQFPVPQVKVAFGKVFVADQQNNRVLIYNTVPTSGAALPDVVLGQPNLTTCTSPATVTAANMSLPAAIWTDGTRLAVADSSRGRVMFWHAIPTANNTPADFEIGQASLTTSVAGTSQSIMASPAGMDSNGNQFVVADFTNNRVLIWNSYPSYNGQPANVVLGQANFTANGSGTTATSFNNPYGVAIAGTNLLVSDHLNNRVQIFAAIR